MTGKIHNMNKAAKAALPADGFYRVRDEAGDFCGVNLVYDGMVIGFTDQVLESGSRMLTVTKIRKADMEAAAEEVEFDTPITEADFKRYMHGHIADCAGITSMVRAICSEMKKGKP